MGNSRQIGVLSKWGGPNVRSGIGDLVLKRLKPLITYVLVRLYLCMYVRMYMCVGRVYEPYALRCHHCHLV